ncbi:hypothetical protein [Nocardia mexicana]|uniref:Porin n=1 Tax=Nocardia mexicana TaxID=279262 RepID=A0A370H5Q3_9NOCA|nr:hypothetical protein [Nocardia mexicana]RDI51544.1 hypothetical protein DFR68_10427 [Nocardia mexicana]
MTKKILAAGLLALGVVGVGSAAAHAGEVATEGSYSTIEACDAEGKNGKFQGDAQYTGYECRPGDDGLFYLFLTN